MTVPLHIETLYNGYETVAAFALAALLAVLSGLVVGARGVVEWHGDRAGRSDAAG